MIKKSVRAALTIAVVWGLAATPPVLADYPLVVQNPEHWIQADIKIPLDSSLIKLVDAVVAQPIGQIPNPNRGGDGQFWIKLCFVLAVKQNRSQ